MNIRSDLINNEFKEHSIPPIYPHAIAFYQKKVRDPEGNTKYFINAILYNSGITYDVQFIKEGIYFNVEWLGEDVTKAVEFFEMIWNSVKPELHE